MATLEHNGSHALPTHVLERVLCALDDSRGSDEAVREAIRLAPCATRLSFISVAEPEAAATSPIASIGERRARHALQQGQAQAAARGLRADAEIAAATDVAAALIARAGDRDLLVAGTHGNSHVHGAPTGSVAAALARRATGPLLIARAAHVVPDGVARILAAVDDSDAATDVVRMAGSIAASCGGYVHLLHIRGRDYGAAMRHRLAELSMDLIELTGAEPVIDVARDSHVAAHVVLVAQRDGAKLVVVGRTGRQGRAPLGAVSERVVHGAPCSVLVAPVTPPAR